MAEISAGLVKELRERTGLGMMECKKALVEAGGDIEKAIDDLRKSGQAKAAKKAGRTAAEGVAVVKVAADGSYGVMVEVNSETDFVARDENFLAFADKIVEHSFNTKQTDVSVLMSGDLETARQALIQKIGENISVRRIAMVAGGRVASYIHSNKKIGVLVALNGGTEELAKDVAMHVAAAVPMVVNPDEVPQAVIDKEREIFSAQAKDSGKPADIIEKMIDGRIRKYLAEVSLVSQPFVKDPDTTVGDLLKKSQASATAFVRYEVGEGIEKEVVDFAAEVMAQVQGR